MRRPQRGEFRSDSARHQEGDPRECGDESRIPKLASLLIRPSPFWFAQLLTELQPTAPMDGGDVIARLVDDNVHVAAGCEGDSAAGAIRGDPAAILVGVKALAETSIHREKAGMRPGV